MNYVEWVRKSGETPYYRGLKPHADGLEEKY
jgi:hypothetical protein